MSTINNTDLFLVSRAGTNYQVTAADVSAFAGGGGGGVASFSAGTTGLTPIAATTGAVTLAGVLGIANGGTGQTTAQAAIDALLPSQGGNSGKFLTTNGSVTAWSATPLNGVATLAEAAAGTITDKYSSPQTAVPKDASGMAGAAILPGSAAAYSGTAATGMIRYNNLTPPAVIEYYNGSAWTALSTGGGGGGVTQITAGTGISISPAGGTGNVTVTSTGNSAENVGAYGFLMPVVVPGGLPSPPNGGTTYTQPASNLRWTYAVGSFNYGSGPALSSGTWRLQGAMDNASLSISLWTRIV